MVVHHITPVVHHSIGHDAVTQACINCHLPCLVDSGGRTSSPSSASVLLMVSTRLIGSMGSLAQAGLMRPGSLWSSHGGAT